MDRVRKLFEHAKQMRAPFESTIRECYRYTLPEREPFVLQPEQRPDDTSLFDTTAVEAVTSLVTSIMTLLIPASKRWAQIDFKTAAYRKRFGAAYAAILNDSNERLQQHFLDSNFYLETEQAMYDAVVAGVGCLAVIDEDGKPLSYMAIPSDQMAFTENAQGKVDAIFREHAMTSRQFLDRFPQYEGDDRYEEEAKRHQIVEAVIPEGGKYRYQIVNCAEWDDPIHDEVVKYSPFIVWRFHKQHSPWGSSPVSKALPAIRSVNRMDEDTLVSADFAGKGLWQVNDENLNYDQLSEQLQPGGVVFIEQELKPVPFPGNLNISLQSIQAKQNQIRALLFLQPQRDPNKTPPTAEQVITDREQFFQRVGSPATRLQHEFLDPVTKQIVGRLQLRDELPRVPDAVLHAIDPRATTQDDVFTVQINAAIVRGMKAAEAINDIRSVQMVYATVGDRMWTYINAEEMTRSLLEDFGIDPAFIRTEEEVKAIVAQQKQQAQMAQLQQTIASPAGKDLLNVVGDQVVQQQAQNLSA